jgi:plastocyanin
MKSGTEEKGRVALPRAIAVAAALSLLLIASAWRARMVYAQETAATSEVDIDNFSFTPKDLTITKGTQVTWVNKDDVPHTVVSVDRKFKSRALDTDEKFSFTFQDAGTYAYFCSVHPVMMGKIIVK